MSTRETPGLPLSTVQQGIEKLYDRLGLLRRAAEVPLPDTPDPQARVLVAEALEELSTALEELTVAEEELRQQNDMLAEARDSVVAAHERYRDLFENAPDAYVVTTTTLRIRDANRAAFALLRPPQHLEGKLLIQYVARGDRAAFRQRHAKLLERAPVPAWECSLLPHHGEPVRVALSVAPVQEPGGGLAGWRWLLRDVTEQRRLERHAVEAAEQERRRLGRDLHDDLGQRLTGASFLAETLRRQLVEESSAHIEAAAEVVELLKGALARTRTLARQLSPMLLDPAELPDALHELAAQTEQLFGVACQAQVGSAVRLPSEEAAMHLYRIAQEAVNNAVKHAEASAITIRLRNGAGGVVLTVQDDGRGIPHEALRGDCGLGLQSMRHRCSLIGAVFDIRQHEGGGTLVACTLA